MVKKFMKWSSVLFSGLVIGGCFATGSIMQPNFELAKVREIEKEAAGAAAAPTPAPSTSPKPQKQPEAPKITRHTVTIEGDATTETKQSQSTDKVISQLHSASMAFSAPEKANIKDDITVHLLIDPSKDLKDLETILNGTGKVNSAKVKISKVVIATLSAPDFTIEKVTPEEQAVAETAPTEWIWTLTPKSTGKNEVKMSITAIVTIDGKEHKYHIKTYEKTIIIQVTPQQVVSDWFSKYWQWLFSTLILPLGLYFYKRHKKE